MNIGKKIIIKTDEQVANIRTAGTYLTTLLKELQEFTKPGQSLLELESYASDFMKKNSVIGSFKGYHGFPANLCLSVNNCLVHGIPNKYILKDGDLLKIDCGVTYKNGISDAAVSLIVGGDDKNPQGANLIKSTKNALDNSLHIIKPKTNMFTFSKSIGDMIHNDGFSVIKNLTGHGVGVLLHEMPYIYNFDHTDMKKYTFQKNMVIAIEPISSIKSDRYTTINGNDRNLYTQKGDMGAQREYTILVTESGYEVLAGVV